MCANPRLAVSKTTTRPVGAGASAAAGPAEPEAQAVAGLGRAGAAASPADLAVEVGRLVEGGTSTRDAVTAVAEATGTPRRTVYQAVLDARDASG